MKIKLTESQVKKLVLSLNEEFGFTSADAENIKNMSPNLTKLMTGIYDKVKNMKSGTSAKQTDNLLDITKKYISSFGGSSELLYPLREKGKLNSRFGDSRGNRSHKGVDIGIPSGTEVLAPADGIVELAQDTSPNGCGGMVKLNHGNLYTKFCHLKRWTVNTGQKVKRGDVIGFSGGARTDQYRGTSTGPHLHYEILDSGGLATNPSTTDPTNFA